MYKKQKTVSLQSILSIQFAKKIFQQQFFIQIKLLKPLIPFPHTVLTGTNCDLCHPIVDAKVNLQ